MRKSSETDGAPEEEIVLRRVVRVGATTLWECLTLERHIRAWWGNGVSLEPREGGGFVEVWDAGEGEVVTRGHVVHAAPPTDIAWTWADEGWPGATTLAVRIEPQPGRSILTLRHTGWRVFPDAERGALIEAHREGWETHLDALVAYAEAADRAR